MLVKCGISNGDDENIFQLLKSTGLVTFVGNTKYNYRKNNWLSNVLKKAALDAAGISNFKIPGPGMVVY